MYFLRYRIGGIFRGENFSRISRFRKNYTQKTKFYMVHTLFLTDSRKFNPAKYTTYTVREIIDLISLSLSVCLSLSLSLSLSPYQIHTAYYVGLMEIDKHIQYFWTALETLSQVTVQSHDHHVIVM